MGKSLTNFSNTIPSPSSGLAQEMTKDPYNFAFAVVTKRHNEAELKLALREEGKDNPTIGLLICRSKDNTQAQYALESSSQPIGISEYELERFYPEKVEGTIPSIEEIEEIGRKTKTE